MKYDETELIRQLREKGISPSPQRLAVYGFLKDNPIHPTADTIMKELKPLIPTLSLTTVYNTLKLFVSRDLVHEVIIEDGELRFDADLCDHAHFKCTCCEKVFDLFPPEGRPVLEKLPALPAGFTVTGVHVCLRGKCSGCA